MRRRNGEVRRVNDERDHRFYGQWPPQAPADPFSAPTEPFYAVPSGPSQPPPRRTNPWRWIRRVCFWAVALLIVVPAVAFGIGYAVWNVPSPDSIAQDTAQTVVLKNADGSELTRIVPSSGDRTMIQDASQDVSRSMRDATTAAEDPTFYQNWGFDFTGILRAVWGQLTGADDGGGSTLTQQYIKLSTGADQHTYFRKFKEIVLAVKLSREQSKNDILTAYLNTAYYGRGAYGIHAAAHTYFGKDPKALDPSEAALLAGMVQAPSNNDPRINPAQGEARWTYVADQMERTHAVTPEQRADMHLPSTVSGDDSGAGGLSGTQYQIRQQVMAELDREGFDQQTLAQHGYTVMTTIDPQAESAAERAVQSVMSGQPNTLHPALVAVDPKTGGVRAYYGGSGPAGSFDYANAPQQPGSSFKPFVALAGLEQNRGLGDLYDGSSPRTIAGTTFANNPGVRCDDPQHCSLREAMTKSVNTVFVDLGVQVGTTNVAQAAHQAGIPEQLNGQPTLRNADGTIAAGISLGMYPVRTIDMAGAYATFANDGMRTQPRFVAQVVDNSTGEVVRDFAPHPQAAFDQDDADRNANLAANVTESLLPVAAHSQVPLAGGRPVASKTGTHQLGPGDSLDNEKAWMVGYTPQISTAVSMSAGDAQNPVLPLRDAKGNPVFGATLPGHVWQQFMNIYLAGKPVIPFRPAQPIGQFFPPAPSTTTPPPSSSSTPPPTTTSETETSTSETPEPSDTTSPSSSETSLSPVCGPISCSPGGQ